MSKFNFISTLFLFCTLAISATVNAVNNAGTCFQLQQNLQNVSILSYAGVVNTGASFFTGDVDTATSTYTAGGATVIGQIHVADQVALNAQISLAVDIALAQNAPADRDLSGTDLGGLTLSAGTYSFSSSAALTGNLTLNGTGIYLFQIGSSLTTAPNSAVILTNGATACNVYWMVDGSATLVGPTTFLGTLIAVSSISQTGVAGTTVTGRLLAHTGAVTFNAATNVSVTGATCNCTACLTNVCLNGGACSNNTGTPSCVCPVGTSGLLCQQNNTCSTNVCLNGGTCSSNNTGTPNCTCAFGFSGSLCSNATDFCVPSPCLHGGVCTNNLTNTPSGFNCNCTAAFSGPVCASSASSAVQGLVVTAAMLMLSLLGLLII